MSALKTCPLLQRLVEERGLSLLDLDADGKAAMPEGLTLLFLPSHAREHLETPDIAAVLPDLLRACQTMLPKTIPIGAAIAAPALEASLSAAIDGLSLPALVVMDGEIPVGAIARMRDWADYLARFKAILAPLVNAH